MITKAIVALFVGVSVLGCTNLSAFNSPNTATVIPVDNHMDSVAIKQILAANSLDTQLVGAVSNIAYYSNEDRTLTIQLYNYALDTLHIPDALTFAAQKVVFYAANNRFKSWQKEAEKIPRLISLDLGGNPIRSWAVGTGTQSLAILTLVDCGLDSIMLPLDRFPSLTSLNLAGNHLATLPTTYTSAHVGIEVRANSICNPSNALDALLQLHDKQWRAGQICPATGS